jgi:hypothetical protein
MVARLEKTKHGYAIPLTAEMVESLHLVEGAAVEVLPLAESADEPHAQIRYASVDEVMKVHREMEPHHAEAYRELAK